MTDKLHYLIAIGSFLCAAFWPGDDPIIQPEAAFIGAVLVWCTFNIVSAIRGLTNAGPIRREE